MQIPISLDLPADTPERIRLGNAEILYYPDFLARWEADDYFQAFHQDTAWRQDSLNFGGRRVLIPRLQAWHGDPASRYNYSGLSLQPQPWSDELTALKQRVEAISYHQFNAVLMNFYRNGLDSVAWHSDDEKELGPEPIVASVSLGATRRFELKPRHSRHGSRVKCDLHHGSLLVMGRGLQHQWQHQVPKQPTVTSARINLTFRYIESWQRTESGDGTTR